jgi:uncharacterized protein
MLDFEMVYECAPTGVVGFRAGEKTYVFNANTAACFEVDELAFEMLREEPVRAGGLSARFGDQAVAEALAEIAALREGSFLAVAPPSADLPDTFGTLELHVSHVCNMACKYCFASQGDYGQGAGLMTEETARRALDFFFGQLGDRESATVVFFGGEPLMNLPVIKSSAVYALRLAEEAGKTVRFSTTTNATLLDDETIAFLNEYDVSVMISIDGPPEVQNSLRPMKGGRPSYPRMEDRIRALSDSRNGRLTARVTVCSENTGLRELARHLGTMGFDRVYCSLMSCDDECIQLSLDDADRRVVVEEYRAAAADVLESVRAGTARPLLFSTFEEILKTIHGAMARPRSCGTGVGIVAVAPSGELFACHRFVGREAWAMGTLRDGVDPAVAASFRSVRVQDVPECAGCWCRHVCAGGCLNSLARDDGSIGTPDPTECECIRELTGITLGLYVQLQDEAGAAEPLADQCTA